MRTTIIYLFLLVMSMTALQAQERKQRVAVFDPTSSGTGIDEGTKLAIREIISSTFVNTGKYTIVERSLLEKVMQEQAFSNSGAVDESQASEIGRLAGANKIVLSVVTLAGGRNMLSIKLVDVQTASVERQKTQIIAADGLLDVVEPLALQLMVENANTSSVTRQSSIVRTGSVNRNVPVNAQTYNPDGIEMVYVEGSMATTGFYIGKYEVTQTQWVVIMGKNPSSFKGANYPVESIKWKKVNEFIQRLNRKTGRNYRLPTESEWSYAANGGKNNESYIYAGSNNIDEVAWYKYNSNRSSHVVGTKAPNSIGIYDMTGNVWEWCQKAVMHGGAWGYEPKECTTAYRYPYRRSSAYVGFRLVLQE